MQPDLAKGSQNVELKTQISKATSLHKQCMVFLPTVHFFGCFSDLLDIHEHFNWPWWLLVKSKLAVNHYTIVYDYIVMLSIDLANFQHILGLIWGIRSAPQKSLGEKLSKTAGNSASYPLQDTCIEWRFGELCTSSLNGNRSKSYI